MGYKFSNSVCNKIKTLRKKFSYSQAEVAEKLNISQNAYSLLEAGKTKIDIERLLLLAQLYKVSIYDLLGDIPPPLRTRR